MKGFLRYTGVLAILIGVMILWQLIPHWNTAFFVPFVMDKNEFVSLKFFGEGTSVDARLSFIMDGFASETVGGVVREKICGTEWYQYNIVPVFIDGKTYYIAVRLSENEIAAANEVIEYTSNLNFGYETNEVADYKVKGTMLALDNELYEHMKEWFVQMSWLSLEEANEYVKPLVIVAADSNEIKIQMICGMVCVLAGIICFVMSFVVFLGYGKRYRQLRKCNSVIESTYHGKTVFIPVREMDDVDRAMWKGKIHKAKRILSKSYKATEEEIEDVIGRWNELVGINNE